MLIRIGPPQCSASVLSPRDFRRLGFSLAIRALVPAVPRKSLHPTHAPSTPVAVCPVIRHLTDFSQKGFTFLVLTTLSFLTTRLRWVHFRSSFGCPPAQGLALSFCSNAHHHGSLPQQLGVVCDLLLKAGPEGPALIFHAASRRSLLLCVALLSICLCSTLKPRNSTRRSRLECSATILPLATSSAANKVLEDHHRNTLIEETKRWDWLRN